MSEVSQEPVGVFCDAETYETMSAMFAELGLDTRHHVEAGSVHSQIVLLLDDRDAVNQATLIAQALRAAPDFTIPISIAVSREDALRDAADVLSRMNPEPYALKGLDSLADMLPSEEFLEGLFSERRPRGEVVYRPIDRDRDHRFDRVFAAGPLAPKGFDHRRLNAAPRSMRRRGR